MVENHTQLNTQESSIQKSSTQGSNIHPINPVDGFDAVVYRGLVMDNIGYGVLAGQHGNSRVDEVVELMLEILLSRRDTIRIAGDELPAEVVKSRLMKVDASHVEYVFESLDRNSTPIRNIKAYLLTALFNAPATMDSFYRAEVNYDFGGNRDVQRP